MDPTFSSILLPHSTCNPCLQLFSVIYPPTDLDLKQLSTSKVAVLPNFFAKAAARPGRLGQEGGELLLELSAEFAELQFSVSHRNSGGGRRVCGQQQGRSCWLAITRCPCARGLPLPRQGGGGGVGGGCKIFYMGSFPQTIWHGNHLICEAGEIWIDLRCF